MTTATSAAPRELDNPVLGIRATTLPAGDEDVFRSEVVVAPGGNAGPPHIHLRQEERFLLAAGRISFRVGRTRGVAEAGDTLVIPPGTVHTFVNGDEEARFVAEFRPALRVEEFFTRLFGLAREGETDSRGLAGLLQAAVLIREYPDEFFYAPIVPVAVQRALAIPLAWIGRRRGLR